MWDMIKEKDFDLIIDDGAHFFDANINFYKNSFDKLKKNGYYIIEDVKDCQKLKNSTTILSKNMILMLISMNSNSSDGSSNLIINK